MNFSNQELVSELKKLRSDECVVLAKFICFLAEAVKREVHLSEGYSSLFDFLVRGFGYSEGAASRRVAAVKVYKIFPEVLGGINTGSVKLSNLHLVSKHVTPENVRELVKETIGKNKLEMECYISRTFNQSKPAPKRDSVKVVSAISAFTNQTSTFDFEEPSQNEEKQIEPNGPQSIQQNFRVSVTLDQETYDKLVRLQELSGKDKISDALDVALEFYLAKKDPEKIAEKTQVLSAGKTVEEKPRGEVRARKYIPLSIRREVFKRDGYQCVHTSALGVRCSARRHLELDHKIPHAYGGPDTAENMQVMCSQHNKHKWKFRFRKSS